MSRTEIIRQLELEARRHDLQAQLLQQQEPEFAQEHITASELIRKGIDIIKTWEDV